MPYERLRALADHGMRLDAAALRRAQARAPGRRGAAAIARLLGAGDLRSRSALERRLLRVCRDAGLPRPRLNARILGRERDASWPAQRIVVEVDGHAFHAARPARADDHERDSELVLAGWRVVRFTAGQVFGTPRAVAATLAALLGQDAYSVPSPQAT